VNGGAGAQWVDNSGAAVSLGPLYERRTARLSEPRWFLEQQRRERAADFVRVAGGSAVDRFNGRMARRCRGTGVAAVRRAEQGEGGAPCFTGVGSLERYNARRAALNETPSQQPAGALAPSDFQSTTEKYLRRMMRFNE